MRPQGICTVRAAPVIHWNVDPAMVYQSRVKYMLFLRSQILNTTHSGLYGTMQISRLKILPQITPPLQAVQPFVAHYSKTPCHVSNMASI